MPSSILTHGKDIPCTKVDVSGVVIFGMDQYLNREVAVLVVLANVLVVSLSVCLCHFIFRYNVRKQHVYIDCNDFTKNLTYMVNIRYGTYNKGIDPKKTNLTIEFLDSFRAPFLVFHVGIAAMDRASKSFDIGFVGDCRETCVMLHTREPLCDLGFIRLTHDGKTHTATINIYSVLIEEPWTNTSTEATVNENLVNSTFDSQRTQTFEMNPIPRIQRFYTELPLVSIIAHFVVMTCQWLPLTINGPFNLLDWRTRLRMLVANTILGSIFAISLFALILLIRRIALNRLDIFTSHHALTFRYSFDMALYLYATGTSIGTAITLSRYEPVNISLFTLMTACFHLVSSTILIPLFYTFRLDGVKKPKSIINTDAGSDGKNRKNHRSPSVTSTSSTGSTYYDQLVNQGNIPHVMSISQYGALLAQKDQV